jgi:hypothetical protein
MGACFGLFNLILTGNFAGTCPARAFVDRTLERTPLAERLRGCGVHSEMRANLLEKQEAGKQKGFDEIIRKRGGLGHSSWKAVSVRLGV